MQKTWRLPAGTLRLLPKDTGSRQLTLAELFHQGPIWVRLSIDEAGAPWLLVEAPDALTIASDEGSRPAEIDGRYLGHRCQAGPQCFDRFLEEETLRVRLEADTIELLKEARCRQRPDTQP